MKRTTILFFAISFAAFKTQAQNNLTIDPIRLEKKITRYIANGKVFEDSLEFRYDDQGRVSATVDMKTGNPRQQFAYENGLLKTITNYNIAGEVSGVFEGRYKESANKDKITLDYSKAEADGSIKDTVLVSYEFKDNRIAKASIYVHPSGLPFSEDKRVYKYDKDGNLTSLKQVSTTNDSSSVVRVLAWDNYKNPFSTMSPANYILLANDFPFNCQSKNNPVKYEDIYGNVVDVDITYNADGYPLTYKRRDQDIISDELFYNR